MRASVDTMTRDLAGRRLPAVGRHRRPRRHERAGPDSITIRSGIVRTDLSCVVTAVTALGRCTNSLTSAAAPGSRPACASTSAIPAAWGSSRSSRPR
jgi:hypothetical protein